MKKLLKELNFKIVREKMISYTIGDDTIIIKINDRDWSYLAPIYYGVAEKMGTNPQKLKTLFLKDWLPQPDDIISSPEGVTIDFEIGDNDEETYYLYIPEYLKGAFQVSKKLRDI